MKLRSLILILMIVLLPLALLTVAVVRLASGEQAMVRQRFRELMEQRLHDINGNIVRTFDDISRKMQGVTEIDDFDVDSLRQRNRREPGVLQLFVISESGQLLYPDPSQPLNSTEQNFLLHTARMFTGQDLRDAVLQQNGAEERLPSISNRMATVPQSESDAVQQAVLPPVRGASSGWFVWYWDRGLNLIYWQQRPSGRIVGAALERSRWIADLIADLPDTALFASASNSDDAHAPEPLESRIRLMNASGETVYQWGRFEAADDDEPFCEIPVTAPLASWRLQCFVPERQLAVTGRSAYAGLFAGLVAVAAALTAMAFVLYRDYSRDMREAAQQVSFVNQVSHELKTPLTNIRLYAELLETDLESIPAADAERPRDRLNVILSEGQRLSRLIGNVLTFARQKRRTLQPQPRTELPDDVIRKVVERFQPALDEAGIRVQLNLAASESAEFDPDFLEQILGNLISNVEKYGHAGGVLRVFSSRSGDRITIDVEDAGPGIEVSRRDEVFRPFSRLSRSVSYAAGTGIGLSIARELARLHGGDIVLVDSECGCRFRVSLQCSG
ncbi:MAG: HAMP domain-containing sensor histidine kinase [Planctomycetaceae bacterium]